MKIAIIHLSDFHIKDGDRIINQKIDGFLSGLNVLKDIYEYAIIFSGDLAFSGQINEYKNARRVFSRLINGIKIKNGNRYVNLFMVPGNHDLCLPDPARDREYIQSYYDDEKIDAIVDEELSYLDNYFTNALLGGKIYDKIFSRRFCTYEDYKIQFNLINSALFSTLEPDDKELHYFPQEKMHLLKKSSDANLCITVMHHGWDWFNWNYKADLSKTIVDNSEMLFTGHEHRESASVISIDNSLDTWISAAGEMDFSSYSKEDSFNVIVIDTESNSFDGYIFNWNPKSKIFMHKCIIEKKTLQSHSASLLPLPSYVKSLKEDPYNLSDDFTKYFVFPKLVTEYKNQFGNRVEIKNVDEFMEILEDNKKVFISGSTNSGKTTLMKHLFISITNYNKVPLLLSVDSKTRIKKQNFIRHLFEEQYGEDSTLYERYQQLDKDKKVILIDGFDILQEKSKENLISSLDDDFEYMIFSSNGKKSNVIDSIKDELTDSKPLCELHIKPFFTEKRNQLVRNICTQKSTYNDEDINNVNRLIDALVHNNSSLFSLNPAFIIRYTNYFISNPYFDYSRGEAVFSKIFEHELEQSIINLSKKSNVDEILVAFEKIAGHMYSSRKDILQIETVKEIVENYNSTYGVNVNAKEVIDIGIRAKVFKQSDDLSIYFYNKNHLAYFIAKHLIQMAQNDPYDNSGIEYALKNICFGINSDIILFISYLLNTTQSIMSIANQAGALLEPWTEVSLDSKNIPLLHISNPISIAAPSEEEHRKIESAKERTEEIQYNEDVIEATGLFEYDDQDIDEFPYRLIRAIKYTEMICKALSSFNSSLKLTQKRELIDAIYTYPRKIIYAMLKPIDKNFDALCNEILNFIEISGISKKTGEAYEKDDIRELFNDYFRAEFLSVIDHFSEICTSTKTISLLTDKEITDSCEKIQKLLIIENSGNSDMLLREAEKIIKDYKDPDIVIMVKLIVRKHIICNRGLPYRKKQQMIDKILGKQANKYLH